MKQYFKSEYIVMIILLVISLLLFTLVLSESTKNKKKDELISSLNTEVKLWKDKDSLNHARISVIETERAKDFLLIKSTDSTIRELQEVVKDFKKYLKKNGSATIINNTTEVKTSTPTTVTERDTIIQDNIIKIYPEYKSNINMNNWIKGYVTSNKDTTTLDIKVNNKYSVVLGEEKVGLFKRKPFAEVVNYNPYTSTKTVRTYQVDNNIKKRFGIGPMIGVSIDGPTVGAGVHWDLIQF